MTVTEEQKSKASVLATALVVAASYHTDQVDRQGQPYLLHVLRVAMRGVTQMERVVGLLHDTLEDTKLEKETIEKLFGAEVLEAVTLLTRNSEQDYSEYIERLVKSGNRLAMEVKLYDLDDNLSRVDSLRGPTRTRLRTRYRDAQQQIEAAIYA